MVNANHIIRLRDKGARLRTLRYLLKHIRVKVYPASDRSRIKNSWIHINDAQTFCRSLGLEAELLQPLLCYANPLQAENLTPGVVT